MDAQKAKQVSDYILKDVFNLDNPYPLHELKKKYAFDIPFAKKVVCSLSGADTWSFSAEGEKIASQKTITEQFKKDEWMRKKKELNTIDHVLKAWQEVNVITGEKYINSKEVAQSDGIYSSAFVFKSVSIFASKNIIFSYKIFDCNYMLASRDDSSCTLGVRVKESIYCSSCFEVSWSSKVSKSMFIHDGFDLYGCLFCSHLRSKKYCIANMQFGKEEYFRIKKFVVDWILSKK